MSPSELYIHGHSCLEIRIDKTSLICDPWLAGSTYWRSWWNFPESTNLDSLLNIWSQQENLFIYITHLHWDHFHGPTLRRIIKKCRNCNFIIPKTPELRLKKDLESFVSKKYIKEIDHATSIKLHKDLSILSFQFGPFFADSILSITSRDKTILNINDAKILDLSLSHLLSLIPKPNYVLRSHSSANSRCCYRGLDGSIPKIKIDKTRFEYSKEFFDACFATKAETAIPFASNMACLHKETFSYNSILNFSDFVINDFKSVKNKYKEMDCKLILPSEKLILESKTIVKNKILRQNLINESRDIYLKNYVNKFNHILKKQYELENSEKISHKLISKYFTKIINSTPFIIKRYLDNKIFLEVYSKENYKIFNLNFIKGTVKEINHFPNEKNSVKVKVNAYVINDVCKKSHWNSLGVSKRLEVFMSPNNKRYIIFNFLCNTIETGGFIPIKNVFSFRFISVWLSRYREIIDLTIFALKNIVKHH